MFNPRPSSGISHSFSKSSNKLDSLSRADSQSLNSVEQSASQNLQDASFGSSKFKSEFSVLSKRNDDPFRDNKPKQVKNLLDFESSHTSNSNIDQLFGTNKPEAVSDFVYEKTYLLKLMFSFERMSKVNNRKIISDPLRFHSVDVTSTYNKEQENFYDKNDKMKRLLYKQNQKRTFFDNQTRLLKGVRGIPLKGMYKDEDGDHDITETEKAFQPFDMRKISETVKFDDPYNNSFKDTSREYRAELTMDLVRQLSRENNLDLSRPFQNRVDPNDVHFSRETLSSEMSKFGRDSKSSELNRLFNAELNSAEMTRGFKTREEMGVDLTKHLSADSASGELTRHLSHEMGRDSLIESFKSVQHSWEVEEEAHPKSNYLKGTNNVQQNSASFTNAYKDFQNKDLLKDVFNPSSTYYKEKEGVEKDEGEQSFLERLLEKPFDAPENMDPDMLNFSHNFVDTPSNMWNELNLQWQYMDPQGMVHGPFSSDQMYHWYLKNFFPQNLRMRYNTKMAWTPFKDLFSANTVPFKCLPKQFTSQTSSNVAANLPSKTTIHPSTVSNKMKDGWSQTSSSNLMSSPNNTFSAAPSKPAASTPNLLAPSNLLATNTSLLGSTSSSTSLLGSSNNTSLLGSSSSNTNLLAPSNLLASSSLLNPASNSLLGPSSSPGLLGHPAPSTASSLLGPGNGSPALLAPSSNSSTSGLLNNRIDNLWSNNQTTVHPISSMGNIHMGVSSLPMNTLTQVSKNNVNKQMAASSQVTSTPALNKQKPSSHMQTTHPLNQYSGVNLNKEFGMGNLSKDPSLGEGNKQLPTNNLQKQLSGTSNNLKKQGVATPAPTVAASVSTSTASTAPRTTNERKWNTPQVEVSSLLEIMELEKKSAQERNLKSPPKPVQTGWNLSNVATNNISESDDFPSLSTVTTTTSNSNTTNSSTGKKFGKHITMPLETFIEKHPYTSPPKLTETFSSKLLGNKN